MLVEAVRLPFTNWLLDYVPDAHLLTAQKIAKFLPLAGVLFRVATPPGTILDITDEIVASYMQTIKDEADRRVAMRAANAAPTPAAHTPPPPPVDDATKNRNRFLGTALRVLNPSASPTNQSRFDDLIAWHDRLNADDQSRLYSLVSNSDDVQLSDLVKQAPAILMVAVSRVKLPPAPVKPKTFLQFRQDVAADAALTTSIKAFLKAKAVEPPKFWKALEHAYPNTVKDKADLFALMNMGDDTVYHSLNLAPNALEVFSTELDASLNDSGLPDFLDDQVKKAKLKLQKAWK
jgi:hypothetical protein